MLTHSSGLPEPADFLMSHLRLKGQPLPDFDAEDRKYYQGVSSLMFEPGSQSAYVNPDYVHIMLDGRIVESGGPDLALKLEERGYDWIREKHAALEEA